MKFQVHTLDSAPAGAKETLRKLVQGYGFVPNLAGALAESPATLAGLVGFMGAFEAKDMTLTALERQIVLLAVSVGNRCDYCTAAHGMLAGMNGLDRAEIENLQQGRPLAEPRHEALRRFAAAVSEKRGCVSDFALEDFVAAGFTKAQVLEVIFGVALKTLTNYANHVAKPPVNAQFAAFLPRWTKAA